MQCSEENHYTARGIENALLKCGLWIVVREGGGGVEMIIETSLQYTIVRII